jgi:hypothetical protein
MLVAFASLLVPADVKIPDLAGKPVQVLPSRAKHGLVAFFVITGCPIANAYAPEMSRIAKEFGPKGWDFRLVYVDSFTSSQALVKHHQDFKYSFPGIFDSSRQLVKMAGATKTPEAAVFAKDGTLLYDGRIDDRYYALGKQRPEARVRDLRNALTAVTAGKPVAKKRTEVVGCFMPMD